MLYFLLALAALGILIIVHEWGHYYVAKRCGMRVDRFAIGFGPAILQKTVGETTFQVGIVPLGGYVQIAGLNPEDENIDAKDPRSYPNRPTWQRALTIAAGPLVNFVFASIVIFVLHLGIGVYGVTAKHVLPNYPAAAAGMVDGDQIFRIEGLIMSATELVPYYAQQSEGKPLHIEVMRSGQLHSLNVTPTKEGNVWRLGIELALTDHTQRHRFTDSLKQSIVEPLVLTRQTINGLANVIRGRQSADFKSPVGIARIMADQMKRGFVRGLQFVALISTLLGFFNLLPFPALDGGRVIFLGWEMITRRPVNHRVEQIVHLVGLLILLPLLFFLMGRDILEWIRGH